MPIDANVLQKGLYFSFYLQAKASFFFFTDGKKFCRQEVKEVFVNICYISLFVCFISFNYFQSSSSI